MGRNRFVCTVGLACAVCLAAPAVLFAEWYDAFYDGEYCQDPNDPNIFDPNLWDIDNPHWIVYDKIVTLPYFVSAASGQLRVWADDILIPVTWLDVEATDGDRDPNTSATWYDDSASHYLVTEAQISGQEHQFSPTITLWHNPILWRGWELEVFVMTVADANSPSGFRQLVFERVVYKWPWEQFDIIPVNVYDANTVPLKWTMLLQYHTHGAVDPNLHSMEMAVWPGDKYDFRGYDMQLSVRNIDMSNPNYVWEAEGPYAVGVYDQDPNDMMVCDVAFDNVECRWGVFTNVSRVLTLKMKDCCDLNIDPDLLDDPNQDPNDLNELRRYTNGTAIVLDTVVPCGNKVFGKWVVKGPNQLGDPLYQEVKDTNAVLYLTMDGDYWVKAVCKCGGGPAPFAAMVLLVLGLAVVMRRLT